LKRLLLCIVMLMWIGVATRAQSNNVVQPTSVYVRSGPGENFVAIGAVFAGDTVQPLNRNEDGLWILIPYGRLTGWLPRDSVVWADDITVLPVLAPNVTPTANAPTTTQRMTPTSPALTGLVLLNNAEVAFVRSGPGRGYARLGQLSPGMLVEPVSRNVDNTWVMIRFTDVTTLFDGFGWVARNLVQWQDNALVDALPVVEESNLTPTLTLAPSNTPEGFVAATQLPSPTTIPTLTFTPEAPTPTPSPTLTFTLSPTLTFTIEAPTVTLITPGTVDIATLIPVVTDTPIIIENTATPTLTETTISIAVAPTNIPTQIILPTATQLPPTRETPSPTAIVIATEVPPLTAVPDNSAPATPASVPVGAIALGTGGILGLMYLGLFAQGLATVRRYHQGFVIEKCPVCERGTLTVETRPQRVFGIPGVKRTVRCSECRSVLREKGTQRWLYAVDRIENPVLYERYNGREITDSELKTLQ
jgi:uncharacterized protein YgiM (DUF1202 family)